MLSQLKRRPIIILLSKEVSHFLGTTSTVVLRTLALISFSEDNLSFLKFHFDCGIVSNGPSCETVSYSLRVAPSVSILTDKVSHKLGC